MRVIRKYSIAMIISAVACGLVLLSCCGAGGPAVQRSLLITETKPQESTSSVEKAAGFTEGLPPTAKERGTVGEKRASGNAEIAESTLLGWLSPKAYAADHGIDERYLIRSGECSVETEDYQATADRITLIADEHGGMVSDSQSSRSDDGAQKGWLVVRVPSDNFLQTWQDILAAGYVRKQKISSQDVSQEYVGGVSRLKNLLAEQATLQKMLDEALAVQRSRGLGDAYKILLDTQERLTEVTGEIEATEDRLNALSDKIMLSTITVYLEQPAPEAPPVQAVEEPKGFIWGLGATKDRAVEHLLTDVRGFLQGSIFFLITCWTWLIPLAITFVVARWIWKRYIRPATAPEPAQVPAE